MSLPFNMPSRLVIAYLPRRKRLLISWLQSPSAVILEPKKIKSLTVSIVIPSICHEVMGLDAIILVFWMLSFKPTFVNFVWAYLLLMMELECFSMTVWQGHMCAPERRDRMTGLGWICDCGESVCVFVCSMTGLECDCCVVVTGLRRISVILCHVCMYAHLCMWHVSIYLWLCVMGIVYVCWVGCLLGGLFSMMFALTFLLKNTHS